MKKSDIRNGMHVITNMGEEYIVMSNVDAPHQMHTCKMAMISMSNGWMPLDDYNDDLYLRDKNYHGYDIKEIYVPKFYKDTLVSVENNKDLFIKLWERARKMTKAEIEAKLGYEIEIVED